MTEKPDEKILWQVKKPYGIRDKLILARKPEERLLPNTEDRTTVCRALHDLYMMAHNDDIDGFATVALRSDGSHYLVVSGDAMTSNIRTAGAVSQLKQLLHSLSNDEENEE